MLILKRRSRSVTFSMSFQVNLTPLFFCDNARSHCEFTCFLRFYFHSIFAINYFARISYHWHILFPVPALHSQLIRTCYYSVMLMFCLLFFLHSPLDTLAMVTSSLHIAYFNSVQHRLNSHFLRILNPCSVYPFTFYPFVHDIEALCIRSWVRLTGAYNGNFVRVNDLHLWLICPRFSTRCTLSFLWYIASVYVDPIHFLSAINSRLTVDNFCAIVHTYLYLCGFAFLTGWLAA